MQLPGDVKYILNNLYKNGYEAYIVGGCVRDYLMGIKPHDYDITTSALPEQVKGIFGHTVDTGIKHGTVTVIINKKGYEITTYRIDGEYKDNRHPEKVFFTDRLSGDLSRRDFTINAIAYNDIKGFVDLFGGMEDIKNRIIRGVGEPSKRFNEDALRMMRAVRFSAQLNFEIEENTLYAIKENASLIKNISIERIREEFFRLILSDHNEKFDILIDSGMTEYFIPEILESNINYSLINTLSCDIAVRLSYILKDLNVSDIKVIMKRLKMDNKTMSEINTISKYRDYEITDMYSARKFVSLTENCAEKTAEVICAVKGYDNEYYINMIKNAKKDCCSLKELAVSGEDIVKMGIKGKMTGKALNEALDCVMRDPSKNTREVLIEYIRGCFNG